MTAKSLDFDKVDQQEHFSRSKFMQPNILGIDVSKRKIDVVLLFENKSLAKQFDNSLKGFKLLAAWLKSLQLREVHACLEATGTYGDAVARFLHEKGHLVSVVNPLRIKGYAASKMQRNKTDKADARLIADFCLTQNPERWFPPEAETMELQALVRRIESLEEMLRMEKNRLEVAPPKTKASLKRIIKILENEVETLKKSVKEHIDNHPNLKQQAELLQSIPGIGEKTSALLLGEIEFARYASARQVAAFAGVTPRKEQSGSSVHQTKLSKLGNGRIRKGLYFPAIVARQHNQIINDFASRLEKNGKTQMQIVCASMRKLLHLAFGVLKHKQPFNPNLAFSS
jgi:transposase